MDLFVDGEALRHQARAMRVLANGLDVASGDHEAASVAAHPALADVLERVDSGWTRTREALLERLSELAEALDAIDATFESVDAGLAAPVHRAA